ncbi:MAG: type II secretion system F family protein [Planctomycetota bacterium]|nr:type II secretion system F family protein [Planctomycetota bacterium]
MATFQYVARNTRGEEVAGVLQADSSAAAVRALDDKKLFPVSVKEKAEAAAARKGGRVKLREVGTMYGQLADLLKAGVPVLRCLDTLQRAGANPRMAHLMRQTREAIAGGESLAEALARSPEVFPSLHVAMVRAGEKGGFLEDVLANLSGFIERQDELAGKVRGALIYPLILCLLGVAVMLFALIGMVPKFKPMFKDIPLPLPSRMLFLASDIVTEHWPMTLGVGLLVGLFLWSMLRSEAGRDAWDRWQFKIPVVGFALQMTCVTRFCRILGTMLANGVAILPALAIAKDAAGARILARTIAQAAESVRAGQTLAQPLREGGMFPAEVIEMIAVAEESNQLEKVLVEIANTVERRTNRKIDDVVKLIEPLVLIVIASAIMFMAVGLLYPIFTMSSTMR